MTGRFITLRDFSEQALIFDDGETRDILKFFFDHLRQEIKEAPMTTALRSFAQGLLIEAIDATYALGYLEVLVTTLYNSGPGLKRALLKAARAAARHWFKHATRRDLDSPKVAEMVKRRLSNAFATSIRALLDGIALAPSPPMRFAAFIRYEAPPRTRLFRA